jgi:release factor glutamine methyltransferase
LIYRGYLIKVFEGVYKPCDDSYLLAENLEVKDDDNVLDMGTGCGIQGLIASSKARKVVSSDISKKALVCSAHNAWCNRAVNIQFIESNLFNNIEGLFDLISFNPPYLPTSKKDEDFEDRQIWNGGKDGLQVISAFTKDVKKYLNPKGRIKIVTSSIGGIEETIQMFNKVGIKAKVAKSQRFFYEELAIIDAYS